MDYAPRRVVSLQPSATLTLRDLGVLDRLVACTKYCRDVCLEIPNGSPVIIADSWTAQADEILAAHPDLVLASVPYQIDAVAQILKAGVRFLGMAPRTLSDIYADIAAIAGLMNVAPAGNELIADMQRSVESVRRSTDTAPRVTVFSEEWGKPIIASQPWVAELVEAAGGQFVGVPGKTIAAEEIGAARPDVLIAAWCGSGDRVPLEKIVEQRSWEHLPAVEQARVYCISDELLNTPASCLINGLHALAWALHPELFRQPVGIRRMATL